MVCAGIGKDGGTFSAGVVTEFKEASYLLDMQLAGINLTQAHAIASTVGDVQFAIWYIMAGGSVSGGVASGATGINLTLTSGAISDIIQAQNHYTDIGLLLNPVFVPADGTIQSFMLNPSSPVPFLQRFSSCARSVRPSRQPEEVQALRHENYPIRH